MTTARRPCGMASAKKAVDKVRSISISQARYQRVYTASLTCAPDVRFASESTGQVFFGTMGTASEYNVFFTGTSLEIEFHEWSVETDIHIPANAYTIGDSLTLSEGDLLEVEVVQMHFHTVSEHTINGLHAPGELHIVTRVKQGQSDYCDAQDGCLAVFAVMMRYGGANDTSHEVIQQIFESMPSATGVENGVVYTDELNLDALLPGRLDYYTYLGSLTTPPCSEIVTWVIFAEMLPVEAHLIDLHATEVAFTPGDDCVYTYLNVCSPPREKTNNRLIQSLSGREVLFVEE